MILTTVQISPSHSTLGNYSLKFRNQLDLNYLLVPCYPNSYLSNSLCELSLLYLASILSPKYVVCSCH